MKKSDRGRSLVGVLILELDRAPMSERGVEPAFVVDLVSNLKRYQQPRHCMMIILGISVRARHSIIREIAANFSQTNPAIYAAFAPDASLTPGEEPPCNVVSSEATAASSTHSSQMNSSWSRTSCGMSS